MHPALHYLGISFNCGLGTPKDVEKAFDYVLKAAEQGLPDAQEAVTGFLMEGTAGVKDPARGIRIELAVAQNSPEAFTHLCSLAGFFSRRWVGRVWLSALLCFWP